MTFLMFVILAFGPLLVDMYHRKDGEVSLKRASIWSGIYIASALLFAAFLATWEGAESASAFLAGYSIEKSLSVDNLMIFSSIFGYFGVPSKSQYRVLHYGIIGSVILRLAFISLGLVAFALFGRLLDIAFGAFVIITGLKMLKAEGGKEEIDHGSRWYVRWTKKLLPVSSAQSEHFFVRQGAIWAITPLFICLVCLEFTDLAFAFDSVPAVLGVTHRMVLVYAAIMFAVIGLRSLYFVLEAVRRYTTSLAKAMVAVLLFVGAKMVIHGIAGYEIPAVATLIVVILALVYCAAEAWHVIYPPDGTQAG